ncbi:MAG: ABC transporter permease [Deltaproteobacteria bacterium]|nr:ABC transporter permease [Deltaproteobacteria bacterium]
MNFPLLATNNLRRNKFRNVLTVLGVAIAIMAFVLLRTVIKEWYAAAEVAAKDRVVTRNKVTFVVLLPKRYVEDIRGVSGVKAATFANWFGAKDPKRPQDFFFNAAVDNSYFDVYDEVAIAPEVKERWMADRQGALVGDQLLKKMGWKVGDTVTLEGSIYRGDWKFRISGIYTATRKTVDRSSFLFHWDYLNESLEDRMKDKIGWVVTRVSDPSQVAAVSSTIDKLFDERDIQTLSMGERAFQLSFMGMISAVLKAVDIITVAILLIMMLILGNTIAMGVRERTSEHGVMKAIGFLPKHVALTVIGEALAIGVLGGGLGIGLAIPILNGVGQVLSENMPQFFPYFSVAPDTAAMAFGMATFLALVASLIPAYQASRLKAVDALRKVG